MRRLLFVVAVLAASPLALAGPVLQRAPAAPAVPEASRASPARAELPSGASVRFEDDGRNGIDVVTSLPAGTVLPTLSIVDGSCDVALAPVEPPKVVPAEPAAGGLISYPGSVEGGYVGARPLRQATIEASAVSPNPVDTSPSLSTSPSGRMRTSPAADRLAVASGPSSLQVRLHASDAGQLVGGLTGAWNPASLVGRSVVLDEGGSRTCAPIVPAAPTPPAAPQALPPGWSLVLADEAAEGASAG